MREVFGEILGEKYFLVIALSDILDIVNAFSWTVLVLEASVTFISISVRG